LVELLGDDLIASTMDGVAGCRPNFDGRVGYRNRDNEGYHTDYVQVFRNGAIEILQSMKLSSDDATGTPRIAGCAWETALVRACLENLAILSKLDEPTPLYVALTWIGADGCLFWEQTKYISGPYLPIDREVLMLPEVELTSIPTNVAEVKEVLAPAIDVAWQSAGMNKSPHSAGDLRS
jgi:hypothetical protein